MPKGISLHIGLNAVDPVHYQGWSGPLEACEADAKDMEAVAKAAGFKTTLLLTAAATRAAVAKEFEEAAGSLSEGDMFIVTYSGHGGQVPDEDGDEDDGLDETWCFHDGQWIDDESAKAWSMFKRGVRILLLSDSCHSGTAAKEAFHRGESVAAKVAAGPGRLARTRNMPRDVARRTYEANKTFYDAIAAKAKTEAEIEAAVLLISGCQDNQLSADGPFNGLFTGTLLRIWKQGAFKGDYRRFTRAIVREMPQDQTPNYFVTGASNLNFEKQKPFTL